MMKMAMSLIMHSPVRMWNMMSMAMLLILTIQYQRKIMKKNSLLILTILLLVQAQALL